jgi:hypothetical protein
MEISNGHSRVNMSCINNHTPLYFSNKYHNRKIILYFIHLVYKGRIVEANGKETNRLWRRWAFAVCHGAGRGRQVCAWSWRWSSTTSLPWTCYRGHAAATSPIDNDTDRRKAATENITGTTNPQIQNNAHRVPVNQPQFLGGRRNNVYISPPESPLGVESTPPESPLTTTER